MILVCCHLQQLSTPVFLSKTYREHFSTGSFHAASRLANSVLWNAISEQHQHSLSSTGIPSSKEVAAGEIQSFSNPRASSGITDTVDRPKDLCLRRIASEPEDWDRPRREQHEADSGFSSWHLKEADDRFDKVKYASKVSFSLVFDASGSVDQKTEVHTNLAHWKKHEKETQITLFLKGL